MGLQPRAMGPQTCALCHAVLPGLQMKDCISLTDLLWDARSPHSPAQAGSPEPPGLTFPSLTLCCPDRG